MATEAIVVDDTTPKPEAEGEDVFSAAFNQITEALETPEKKPGDKLAAEAPATEATSDEGLPPTEAEKAAQAAADAEAARVAAEAAKATQAPPQQIDAAELARQIVEAAKPRPQEQAPQPQQEQSIFTKDELDYIAKYQEEFPDIARAEAMVRRAEYRNVVAYVFGEITKELRPLVETVQLMASRVHLGDLQQRVPDYAVTRDQVVEWVGKQPDFLRAGMQAVVDAGTPDQVAKLVEMYKAAHPSDPAQQAQGGQQTKLAPVVKPVPKVLDARAQAALAALSPVPSKRGNTSVQVSPDDFDGAFEEAAKVFASAR